METRKEYLERYSVWLRLQWGVVKNKTLKEEIRINLTKVWQEILDIKTEELQKTLKKKKS